MSLISATTEQNFNQVWY